MIPQIGVRRSALLLFLALAILLTFACKNLRMSGDSMEPTLHDGQTILANTRAYNTVGPQRGDIIVFERNGVSLVARVIGLPGETVQIHDGAVYVNGEALAEPYLAPGTQTQSQTTEFTVPERGYFVMKDNRPKSRDSRDPAFGYVLRETITGRIGE